MTKKYGLGGPGGLLMLLYRISNRMYNHHFSLIGNCIDRFIRLIFSCELSGRTKIGKNSVFSHNGLGCVVNPDATIGNNVKIMQNVTIGGKNGKNPPVICDDVFIGAGAVIIGEVNLGKGCKIGANAVVLHDVPCGCTAVGVPAKILQK